MSKTDLNSFLCCFCFDRKSAIFVICSLAIFHSVVNVALATKVLLQDDPHHVYVIAIAVKINDAPQRIKTIYLWLAQIKLALFIIHFLSSLNLVISLHFSKRFLRVLAPVFVATEVCALIYTVGECLFTTIQLDDSMSRVLVATTMVITSCFMFWCSLIIITYTKSFFAADPTIMNEVKHNKHVVAYYKGVEGFGCPKSYV